MKNIQKYTRGFFEPPECERRWAAKSFIDKAPTWCSVDLRDGNQALITPLSLDEKLRYFELLCKIGFKEIEIGFPAASQTEYEFCRALIERNLIPDGVAVQVLTQAREHIIAKTFDALKGAKNAVVHLYNSTSPAQREQVFGKSKDEIIDLAVSGAKLLLEYAGKSEGNFRFEYSPESFTATETDFALEICNAVIRAIKPSAEKKLIINLPVTVELSMPHVYANQVEYMCDRLEQRENLIISLHPHNDRGCAVADCELGILAGAQRVEGTLFGNGERTGNADIVTLALNMYSQGVDPGLEFGNIPYISEKYEEITGLRIYDRQPYSGALVFAAFSGSHQDAIAKGMKWNSEHRGCTWNVPYLPIDPRDIGRKYDGDVIRINSQSGKGGIGFILSRRYGYVLPAQMREAFGYEIKAISDKLHRELKPGEILEHFNDFYVNIHSPIALAAAKFVQTPRNMETAVTIIENGERIIIHGSGNGRLDAVSNALKYHLGHLYNISCYEEHALTTGSGSQAAAYVSIFDKTDTVFWGVGVDTDIITASILALISAVNRMEMFSGAQSTSEKTP